MSSTIKKQNTKHQSEPIAANAENRITRKEQLASGTPKPGRAERVLTFLALGPPNVWRVFVYRLKKSSGCFRSTMPIGKPYAGLFFQEKRGTSGKKQERNRSQASNTSSSSLSPNEETRNHTQLRLASSAEDAANFRASYTMFSHIEVDTDGPPDWFSNPLNGVRIGAREEHWSRTEDFSEELGDIKTVWEASRFDWLPKWAWETKKREAKEKGGQAPLPDGLTRTAQKTVSPGCFGTSDEMEQWVSNWVQHNPVNQGPNWRCGQEVSIRALNMLLTGKILSVLNSPSKAMVRFLTEHAGRLPPTLAYAVGQDTNHATTEAVALFLLGHYLKAHGVQGAQRWRTLGRYWLEERVRHLIGRDGSFAQYSVNYHRLMLMTLALAEAFRRDWHVDPFSNLFYTRALAATDWLSQMTDPVSGDAPNLGPNDGAHLFNIDNQRYRDFRPAVQFAAGVFLDQSPCLERSALCDLFSIGPRPKLASGSESPSCNLNSSIPSFSAKGERSNRNLPLEPSAHGDCSSASRIYPDGGFVKLAPSRTCWGVVRFANFRTRPKEADVLHLDLWRDGVNILRDGGTYCYSDVGQKGYYFTGTASHNTVQFDGRDQMRRVGRFLFGDWISMTSVSPLEESAGATSWSAGYSDYAGASHNRSVTASNVNWTIEDTINGFRDNAVIRWRLAPAAWELSGNTLKSHLASITIASSHEMQLRLTIGRESRRYLELTEIPVLEVEASQEGTYVTQIEW